MIYGRICKQSSHSPTCITEEHITKIIVGRPKMEVVEEKGTVQTEHRVTMLRIQGRFAVVLLTVDIVLCLS